MSAKDQLSARVKYYLLDWRDRHTEDFERKYGEVGLKDLTHEQLTALFMYATDKDYQQLIKIKP